MKRLYLEIFFLFSSLIDGSVYRIILFFVFFISCQHDYSSLRVSGQDTTSHRYTWETYTFGLSQQTSRLYDIAVIDDQNVWAVGEIYADSTQSWLPYNAVHWNGQQWELKRIQVFYHGNYITPTLEGTFLFSDNDMWVTSGVPKHWNGNSWTQYHLWDMGVLTQEDGGVTKIWGASPDNIYFVGRKGTTVHYDGQSWQRIESGVEVDLTDIWGSGPDNIWACGHETSSFASVLLHYNGSSWQKVWESGMNPPNYSPYSSLHSLWYQNSDSLILVGDRLYLQSQSHFNTIRIPDNFFQYFQFSIRGNAYNNLFVVGDNLMVWHYNGNSWKDYPFLMKHGRLYAVSNTRDQVWAAGRLYVSAIEQQAIIYHGTRILDK
jgi:hypothetical protein